MRRIDCKSYGQCLDEAAMKNRDEVKCDSCGRYVCGRVDGKVDDGGDAPKGVIIAMEKKICSKCGVEKTLDEFSRGVGKSGRKAACKKCDAEYFQELKVRKNNGEVKGERIKEKGKRKYKHRGKLTEEKIYYVPLAGSGRDRASELAEAHWEYIKGVLEIHGQKELDVIEYHYKTAMIHGYKHGQTDAMAK